MSILNIQKAERGGAHLLISLFGPPEGGKTYSALHLAYGMTGGKGPIGLLDTENRRGRLHCDVLPDGFRFDIGELTPPFTPERYVMAIREFEAAGYPVLIIDSFSHVWQGEGGVLDMADRSGKTGQQKWLGPKTSYRRLLNAVLNTRMHIILCSRAKQPLIEGLDAEGKKTLIRGPWREIQDRDMRYEMTVVLQMEQHGTFRRVKCPGPLVPIFADGLLIGVETGEQLAAWVAGGEPINRRQETLKLDATDAAEAGTEEFRAFWKKITPADRTLIAASMENYKSIAETADIEAKRRRDEADASTRETAENDDPFATTVTSSTKTIDETSLRKEGEPDRSTGGAPAGEQAKEEPEKTTGHPTTEEGWAELAGKMFDKLGTAQTQMELLVIMRSQLMEPYQLGPMADVAPQQFKAVEEYYLGLLGKLPAKKVAA